MLDQNLSYVIEFINAQNYRCIMVPGYSYKIFLENSPEISLYSYIASHNMIGDIDAIVVHKGLMHRIDKNILFEMYFGWTPVFANDVFCVFALKQENSFDHRPLRQHLKPIANFVAKLHEQQPTVTRPTSAVIVSAYGVHNVGDDLVSIASEQMLRDVGVAEIIKSGPAVTFSDIESSDLIALGGGGLLYDSDQENLENYLYPLRAAAQMGKRTVILGVGSQGLNSPMARKCTARVLHGVDMVSVRSALDKEVLGALDNSVELEIMEGQDMAFYVAENLRARASIIGPNQKIALFSISTTIRDRLSRIGIDLDDACDAIIFRLKECGFIVRLALHSTDDEVFYDKLSQRNGVSIIDLSSIGIYGTASIYASSELVITSRFHAVIYGAIFGKSVISLYGKRCKSGRLLKDSLKSILKQSEEIEKFNLDSLTKKISNASPVKQGEVDACERMAKSVRQRLSEVLATAR